MTENDQEFLPSEMCLSCPTRDIAFFASVTPEDLHDMAAPIHSEVIEKGDKFYGVGEPADFVYTLHDGALKLVQGLATGEQRIVRLLKRGDLAGTVLDFSTRSLELHANLMEKWQKALVTSDTWLTKLSTGTSRHRVARQLIWLAETCNEEKFILPEVLVKKEEAAVV